MKNLEFNPELSLLGQMNVNGVKMTLDMDEMEDVVGGKYHPRDVRSFLTGCGGATAGLALAFVGLATLTAASGGLATGLAVGGWIFASAQWGATCG